MAYYRQIYTTFWTDSKVTDDFTPEDKYFYLYLLTNSRTNLCGCYEISTKQIVIDTGYNSDTVQRLFGRLENVHGVLKHCPETKEVLLLNWHKYNWNTSSKLLKGIADECVRIKNPEFRRIVTGYLAEKGYPIKNEGYPISDEIYPMDTSVTVTVTDTVSVTDTDTVKKNDSFDEFWAAYPKKVGKKDAQKAFAKAIKTVDLDTMLNAISVQKESDQWSRDNSKYIPNPSTWLNQGRWDDELAPKGITTKNGRAVRDDAFWDRMAKGEGL